MNSLSKKIDCIFWKQVWDKLDSGVQWKLMNKSSRKIWAPVERQVRHHIYLGVSRATAASYL